MNEPMTIEQVEALLAGTPATPATPYSDPTATWVYWTDMDSIEQGIPDEWVWERLRLRRNALIAECDWRVLPDAPGNTQEWVDYRQALRDLPKNTADPRRVDWPMP
jgi:hypothetical protein